MPANDTTHLSRMIDHYQRVIDAIEANEPLTSEEEFELDFLPISESLIDYSDEFSAVA